MQRIAIVTDSNSSVTQNEASELGLHVIPMPFALDGAEYFEDINLTQQLFYKRMDEGASISTSQPSIGTVLDCWNMLLKDYDEIVHIPMSSGLSASCESAMVLAKDFNGLK